ncbi:MULTISPECIES: energy transducer TonB [Sphingomonas]|uniref:energy transducer TonB n=1 Tax=Sphingomonas TaxID=13687 RepID=UPI000DEEAB5A|nr:MULTISPECIES: energy transducer TonB [Sphingomonas]
MSGVVMLTAAAAATLLQPTSKWIVDFDETQCTASRDFGTAERPLTLLLKAPVTGDVIQLFIARGALGTSVAQPLQATVSWGGAAPRKIDALTFRAVTVKRQMFLINLPRTDVAAAAAAGASDLKVDGLGLGFDFNLGPLANMLKVMDSCVSDLATHWNYHDDKSGAADPLKTHAKGPLVRLFSSDDYPSDAVRNDQSGEVAAVLLINPDGKVADCTLTKTSGVAVLDAQTCAIVRDRARLQPAIGLDGKAARDVYTYRVRWRMP